MTGPGATNGTWTEEAVLRESWRWTHVPRGGVLVEDDRRTLVHPAGRRGERRAASRVWRSRAADEEEASGLISETLTDVREAGGTRLIWHTGHPMAPPFMDSLLLGRGFRISEELEVLAFELGDAPELRLPRLGASPGICVRVARDAEDLRRATFIESEVFASPAPTGQELAEFAEGLEKLERRSRGRDLDSDEPLAFRCLALAGDEVVASAGAQVVGQTLRLWGAGTLKPHRGRGAYRALVIERCRIAHDLGATLALTKANAATSSPTLKAAGFRPVSRERRFVIDVAY